jgi:hypothetical protein
MGKCDRSRRGPRTFKFAAPAVIGAPSVISIFQFSSTGPTRRSGSSAVRSTRPCRYWTASDVSNSNVADYKSALHTSRGQPHAMIRPAPRYMEGWAVPNRVGLPQIFLVIATRPDGYWKDGVFTRFTEVDLKALEQAFAEQVLAQLHKRELIAED